jgi:hypothetical protein
LKIWLITQSVDLSPENWDTAADLDKTQRCGSLIQVGLGWDGGNLFRLVEVGNVAIMVDATPEVPSASPETGPPTDEV